jgi:hypothetical protein
VEACLLKADATVWHGDQPIGIKSLQRLPLSSPWTLLDLTPSSDEGVISPSFLTT